MQKPSIDAPGAIAFPPLTFFTVGAGGMVSPLLFSVLLPRQLTRRTPTAIFAFEAFASRWR